MSENTNDDLKPLELTPKVLSELIRKHGPHKTDVPKCFASVIDALLFGTPEDVDTLLAAGANPNATRFGQTALMYAITLHSPERVVKALLDAGADIRVDFDGHTALDLALMTSTGTSRDVAQLMIRAANAAQIADMRGTFPEPEQEFPISLEDVDTWDYTKYRTKFKDIIAAAKRGDIHDVRAVIAQGERIAGRPGQLALAAAAEFNPDPSVLTALVEAGVDVNAIADERGTALMIAAGYARKPHVAKIVALLYADTMHLTQDELRACLRSRVDARNEKGETALLLAAGSDACDSSVVDALLAAGANVNASDKVGVTPLMLALSRRRLMAEVAGVLIKAGACLEARDRFGLTILMRLARMNECGERDEAIELLLRAGVQTGDWDAQGLTAQAASDK